MNYKDHNRYQPSTVQPLCSPTTNEDTTMAYRFKYGTNRGLEPSQCETQFLLIVLKEARDSIPAIEAELKARHVDIEGTEQPIKIWQNQDRYDG
ncbi:MAG: hypothetical protein ACJ71W_21735 [Terriglobales bacterium]